MVHPAACVRGSRENRAEPFTAKPGDQHGDPLIEGRESEVGSPARFEVRKVVSQPAADQSQHIGCRTKTESPGWGSQTGACWITSGRVRLSSARNRSSSSAEPQDRRPPLVRPLPVVQSPGTGAPRHRSTRRTRSNWFDRIEARVGRDKRPGQDQMLVAIPTRPGPVRDR